MTLIQDEPQEETLKPLTATAEVFDVIIVGGGVAGLTAGIYAARDDFKTLILEGEAISSVDYPGGALMLTPEIENFPGFLEGEGAELIASIRAQAEKFGAEIVEERATQFDFATTTDIALDDEVITINSGAVSTFHTITTSENTYQAKTVILAMGATARLLQVAGELEFYGRGVSTCATCDGYFFKNKNVAVVGGGDTAVEDALFLTRYSDKVYLVVRGDTLRASGPQSREILTHPKVEILWNTVVSEILGEDNVTGVTVVTRGAESALELDGVFVAIGRDPATAALLDTGVELDEEGYIAVIGDSTHALGSVEGVFGAGDVVDKIYKQAITSAGKGAQAALEARHYLLSHN